MVLLEDAHVATRIQLLSSDAWNEQWKLTNGQIDLAALERGMKILQPDLDRSQFHSRGLAQQQFDDGRKQHDNAGVEGEDPEGPVRFAGPKMHLLVAKTLHSIQQRTDRLLKFKRFGGRLHMQCNP